MRRGVSDAVTARCGVQWTCSSQRRARTSVTTSSDARYRNVASFNFGANVSQGVHQISIRAKISTSTAVQNGEATAYATIGKGSVVVTE